MSSSQYHAENEDHTQGDDTFSSYVGDNIYKLGEELEQHVSPTDVTRLTTTDIMGGFRRNRLPLDTSFSSINYDVIYEEGEEEMPVWANPPEFTATTSNGLQLDQQQRQIHSSAIDEEDDYYLSDHGSPCALMLRRRRSSTETLRRSSWRPLSTSASLKDWKMHRILGEGYFGQVWLVSDQSSNERTKVAKPCAMKVMAKYDLVEEDEVVSVLREKAILQQIKHPFIVQLIKTYHDEHLVYMLMEMVQGGELFTLLHNTPDRQRRALPEDHTQFYTFCLSDALTYIHEQRIVYRDLKAENILIDAQGYPVLIDFGLAKRLEDGEDRTYTMRGTPNYLAPEVIDAYGHNGAADYWSLGILVYEMLTGRHPFYKEGMDQMELFESILEDEIEPPTNVSDDAHDFVTGLLIKDQTQRLGGESEYDVLNHNWFMDLDLAAVQLRLIDAPWVPVLRGAFDTSCFDAHDHEEFTEDKTKKTYPKLSCRNSEAFEDF